MGREISYGFIPEARLEFLEDPTLVFLKFLVVHACRKSFLNEGMKYGCLGCAVLANFSELSLRFLLMHAYKRRRGYLTEKHVVSVFLVEAIGVRVWGP